MVRNASFCQVVLAGGVLPELAFRSLLFLKQRSIMQIGRKIFKASCPVSINCSLHGLSFCNSSGSLGGATPRGKAAAQPCPGHPSVPLAYPAFLPVWTCTSL